MVAARAALVAAIAGSAAAVPLERKSTGVAVELTQLSATEVSAKITNTASEEVSLLSYNSLLDDETTEKVTVAQNGSPVQFQGLLKNYLLSDIPEDAYTTLAPGASVTTKINLPAVHDIQGGAYEVFSNGAIAYAAPNSTEIAGVLTFESNKITMDVTPEAAAQVENIFASASKKIKRTVIQNCSGTQNTALRTALTNSANLARAAATAATSGSATKFNEYFKTTAAATRSTVAARLNGVVRESTSTTAGSTRYSCTDTLGGCSSNVLAYTSPSTNFIANCPLYYSALPALTKTCHAQDQATTSLHEFTHAPGTYSPGTQDNGYGYANAAALTSARAVLNADTYALYANAIYVGC